MIKKFKNFTNKETFGDLTDNLRDNFDYNFYLLEYSKFHKPLAVKKEGSDGNYSEDGPYLSTNIHHILIKDLPNKFIFSVEIKPNGSLIDYENLYSYLIEFSDRILDHGYHIVKFILEKNFIPDNGYEFNDMPKPKTSIFFKNRFRNLLGIKIILKKDD